MNTPEIPKMIMHGELVDVPEDAFSAWLENGCPDGTKPPTEATCEAPVADA